MSDIAIKVEGLGKEYSLGQIKSGDFRNSFNDKIKNLFTKTDKGAQNFWALKDLNFEVKKGDTVGIIGKNGAGKSTLLKILSQITHPTKGRYLINGRISSLLEVGTGFHSELSGRENIYLNGTILGMRRAEIKRKFDEIVAFSGVEKFLDTPVKHYSSGMKVRLAFSVAAHLEPEILIIDEVLAVGDAEFQRKCLGKMDEVSKDEGRTIVFVSHNMGAVEALCKKGIVLDKGTIGLVGNTTDAIRYYLDKVRVNNSIIGTSNLIDLFNHPDKKCTNTIGLQKAEILVNNKPSLILSPGDDLQMIFHYKIESAMTNPILGVVIKNPHDEPFIGINNKHTAERLDGKILEGFIQVNIPDFSIYGSGKCGVDLYFGDNEDNFDILQDAFFLDLKASDIYKTGVFVNQTINKVYQPKISFSSEKFKTIVHTH